MLLILTTVTFFLLGRELSARVWRTSADPPAAIERIVSALTIGFTLWLGSLWLAALTGQLNAPFLAVRNVAVAAAVAALWFLRWRQERGRLGLHRPAAIALIGWIAVGGWMAFILWRGAVIPPVSHDALAYHLPKAALYARAEGYDPLTDLPARARNIPVNYELLLTEVLILEGDDTLSEWPSAVHYLFFIAAAVALARRWWGDADAEDWTLALVTAAVPVALLHSGAHKNDLMTAAFMIAALVWLGRFITTRELRSLVLAAAALAMAAGTKPQAAILALAAMPFAVAALWKHPRFASRLATIVAISLLFVMFLGGAYWFVDRAAPPSATGTRAPAVPVSYGDWENVWQVPYVLLSAPFSRSATALPVPWSENAWFWRRYEIYFSELGIPFAVCALLLPMAVVRYRKLVPGRRSERAIVSLIAATTFLAMLPVVFRPLGFYAISAPRYVLFLVPIVFAWTIAPFLRADGTYRKRISFAIALLIFVAYGTLNARRDAFAPMDYVQWASAHRGTRVIPFDQNRAASMVDRVAGGEEAVAIEAAEGTWLYPAFGADLLRPVQILKAGVIPRSPPNVEWVVVDRKFTAVWKHDDFHDLGEARRFLTRGDVRLKGDPFFDSFAGDPGWQLLHLDERAGQAIFRRTGGKPR